MPELLVRKGKGSLERTHWEIRRRSVIGIVQAGGLIEYTKKKLGR